MTGRPSLLPAEAPRTRLPAGACDCHMHVYGDPGLYPTWPRAPFRPEPGGDLETYLRLRALLGIDRTVVVQPTAYGADNRCTLDAMARIYDLELKGPMVYGGSDLVPEYEGDY